MIKKLLILEKRHRRQRLEWERRNIIKQNALNYLCNSYPHSNWIDFASQLLITNHSYVNVKQGYDDATYFGWKAFMFLY